MAGFMALPSVFDMGGGIDLTKYRYKVVKGTSVSGKGFLIGVKVETTSQKFFTLSVDEIQLQEFRTLSSAKYRCYIGFAIGTISTSDGNNVIVNSGLDWGSESTYPIACPIPYRSNISLTIEGTITVLEYVG